MSRTDRTIRRTISACEKNLVPVCLLVCAFLSGCDGGLFGTGDGGDASEVVASADLGGTTVAAPVADINEQDNTVSGVESGTSEAESPAVDPGSPVEAPESPALTGFSNTLPSGLDALDAPVPALKLINLGDLPVNVSVDGETTVENTVTAQPGATSDWLPVNTGESQILLSSGQNALASFSPLNSVDDSLTTLIVSIVADPSSGDVPLGETTEISLLPLDTRAVASASQMVEVRFIRAPGAKTDVAQSRYSLVPDDSDIDGGEFMFTLTTGIVAQASGYQLIVPGNYLFSSSGDSFAAMPVSLQADSVYTLIITGDDQNPVYVEVDSQVPD